MRLSPALTLRRIFVSCIAVGKILGWHPGKNMLALHLQWLRRSLVKEGAPHDSRLPMMVLVWGSRLNPRILQRIYQRTRKVTQGLSSKLSETTDGWQFFPIFVRLDGVRITMLRVNNMFSKISCSCCLVLNFLPETVTVCCKRTVRSFYCVWKMMTVGGCWYNGVNSQNASLTDSVAECRLCRFWVLYFLCRWQQYWVVHFAVAMNIIM